ncbi:hypothetical protein KUW09_14390 [Mameliella alba]|nr:hypothetical protein [Antarctobacter heliothermus]MBY6145242.1 hypothetical protein [Mameliella alba]MCA0954990.1 hypothetical protein [Mameliella alba]
MTGQKIPNAPHTTSQPFVSEVGPPLRLHPDSHLLDDWAVYGPKNPKIEKLVRYLALDHGLRVSDIENRIVLSLEEYVFELIKDE